ncbi:MHS family MFS transporter [Sinimarinibacterium sp. CAU 1509]|uniref:MFS transporter n=1 Tax=Sinimarinibacterium sp. CAU 1509 TaxID=2562283 RepID=UPI0010AC019B|nr:MFS transporter [Sinimarinibacterium sp. CAU 1509]TJY59497.1 MHS family MFS transporter [Sinimarinibacterium sp. CAU 1509]
MSTLSSSPAAAPSGHERQTTSHGPVAPGEIAIGVIIGRLSEFFDFFVFGIASALVFPRVFFPFVDEQTATMYSFAIFSLAFIARPFGSLLFRVIHKRYGRGTKLTVALFMLGTATAGIAFLPTYETIGMAAVAALALLRVAQGLGIAGSWDGLPSLLALNAPAGRRGWYAMIPQLGAPLGFLIAAALFAYLTMQLSEADFLSWGWRYPFYVAFAINVVALFARLRLVATPEFTHLLKSLELVPSPLGELVRTQGRNIVLGSIAPLGSFALFHLVTVFPLSWATLFTKDNVSEYLLVQACGAVLGTLTMLTSGVVADRIGRRATLAIGAALIAVFSLAGMLPMFLHGSKVGAYLFIVFGFALLGFTHAQAAGAINSSFASRYRYSGAVLTSDFAWLLGAAFAPLVALSIAAHFGVGYVGLYLLSGAVGTLVALLLSRNLEMRDD